MDANFTEAAGENALVPVAQPGQNYYLAAVLFCPGSNNIWKNELLVIINS